MSAQNTLAELNQHRLPTIAIPDSYDICITPDLEGAVFSGQEKISLSIQRPLSQVVLNAAELVISEAILTDASGTKLTGTVSLDAVSERATISFDGTAGVGQWDLCLKFTGILNNKLRGFYRSSYKTSQGKDELIATTKFEPCDARRAFPCFDEPAFKASFSISLVIADDLSAVSNARLVKETALPGNKKLLEFAPTIKMSTYLVAYIVGKLEASEPVTANGTEIRVWATPGKKHLTSFALEAAKFSLEYFAGYFEQPYPGDKLDLVAIPDFASGAMENFGCITFRETALLVDKSSASHAELERVAEVVAHENAHMWFGDFVTMSWWNGLWLNEAFATFMAAKCLHAFKPEWKFWEGFNVQRAVAMRVDGLHSTRSIEFPVNNPEEARGMFDVLTYEKGCAVLRMLELFLGEENFRQGIVGYLDKHAFANADTHDLWDAIEQATDPFSAKVTVTEMMNTWIFQAGYPVVSVSESAVSGAITLSQRPFKFLSQDKSDALVLWHIPVSIRAQVDGGTVEKTVCLSKASETIYLGENVGAVVVNAGGNGFFRVEYEDSLKARIVGSLSALSASERFNFVSDLWATVLAGNTPLCQYLKDVERLAATEDDSNVFTVILGSLHYLRRIVSQTEAVREALVSLARRIVLPALSRLGWDSQQGETPQAGQLRGSLVSILGIIGDKQVHAQAAKLFERHLEGSATIDANLLPALVDALSANGDEQRYRQFCQLKGSAATPQEEQRYLFALAAFRDEGLIKETLGKALDGSVRTQDAPFLLRSLLMNPAAARLSWEFVKANWPEMVKAFPMSGLSRMCEGVTALADVALAEDVRNFFSQHKVQGGEKAVAQYLETLRIAVEFSKREKTELEGQLASA